MRLFSLELQTLSSSRLVESLAEMEKHDIKVERDIIFREPVEVAITIEADENEESNDIY